MFVIRDLYFTSTSTIIINIFVLLSQGHFLASVNGVLHAVSGLSGFGFVIEEGPR